MKFRIFISSVQDEFAAERRDEILGTGVSAEGRRVWYNVGKGEL